MPATNSNPEREIDLAVDPAGRSVSDGYCEYPGCSRYQYAPELHSSPAYCAFHLFTMDDDGEEPKA